MESTSQSSPSEAVRPPGSDSVHQVVGLIVLFVLVAMKAVAAFRYRFNTDETQHMHIVWGLARGMIQYRDLFDNHPPLFAMVMAPIFRLFPERADIVVWMRLLMIPFYASSIVAIYRIGRALFGIPVAVWLALIAGVVPGFFFPGTEFRPDDPYTALWLWVLVVAVEKRFTTARAVAMGFLFGICTGITMKTALLVTSLSMAAGVAFGLRCWFGRWRPAAGQLLFRAALLVAASLVVPGLLMIYFALHHAVGPLIYCVLKHNVVPHAERWGRSPLQYLYLPIGLPFLLAGAVWIYKSAPNEDLAVRRVLIAFLPAVYPLLLYGYWPEITDHDLLPALPLVPLAVMALTPRIRLVQLASYVALPAAFVACLVLIWRTQVLQRASVRKYVAPIATVLSLTGPDDYVMDVKGDAIYRQRPIYYEIETFTRVRMKTGWIKDDLAERLVETRTAVCFHPPYPLPKSMKFIDSNYLPLASSPRVWVLGKILPAPAEGAIEFTVSIPGDYVFLQQDKPVTGVIDGRPSTTPQILDAGDHRFVPADSALPVTLFWARAWNQGCQPGDMKTPD